jgi:hypothetical protein
MSQLTNYKVALERRKKGRKRPRKNLPIGKRQVENTGIGQAVERLKRVASGRAGKNASSATSGVIG